MSDSKRDQESKEKIRKLSSDPIMLAVTELSEQWLAGTITLGEFFVGVDRLRRATPQ